MKPRLSYLAYAFAAIALTTIIFSVSQAIEQGHDSTGPYWEPVERAIGKNGTMLPGGVFKISLPRSHPEVAIGNVRLMPAMAFDSWISFMRMGDGAMMMGDLVLTADEVGPVQAKLSAEGIDITAIHNTLIGESPQVYDMHVGGYGDSASMAGKVRAALDTIGMPYEEIKSARDAGVRLDEARLDRIMGYRGAAEDGIYVYEVPRAEKITEGGMEIPPTMDVATVIKFQPLGNGKAAITGDFVLRPGEVKPVIKTLNENGITVTALHTHMLTEEPRLFMLHFWATGDEARLAQGLRLALSQTNSKK